MSSYESLIGRAILSSDPAERQACEDAVTVKLYASRNLWDQSQTVVIEAPGLAPSAMPASDWDVLASDPRILAKLESVNARVLDGRVLFAKPARKPRAAKPAKPAGAGFDPAIDPGF